MKLGTRNSSTSVFMCLLVCFLFLSHYTGSNVAGQDLSLLIQPMLRRQNFELVLALNSCLETEQINYLSLWNKVRAQRLEFEAVSIKGLTRRQTMVMRTARPKFESRILEHWQSMFLDTLSPTLELNWLQTSLIEKLLQRDYHVRSRLLLNAALSQEQIERSWNKLSRRFEQRLEGILFADQLRYYRDLRVQRGSLMARNSTEPASRGFRKITTR